MNIEIFRKEFGGYYNYLVLDLLLPTFLIGKLKNTEFPGYVLRFKFGNSLQFTKDSVSYHFKFRIFGLGFSVYRQWDF